MSVWAPTWLRGGTYVGFERLNATGFERLYATGFETSEREGLFKGTLGKEKAACNWSNEYKQRRGDIMLKRMLELVPLYTDEKLSEIQNVWEVMHDIV